MPTVTRRTRGPRAARRILAATAGAVVLPAAFALPAMAAEPPAIGHQVISFPQRDFVSATGYTAGVPAYVQVQRRNAATGALELISQSSAVMPQDDPTTSAFDGLVEVNHPGGGCWMNVTPDIRPGDKVRVFQQQDDPTSPFNDPISIADDTTTTADVQTGRPQLKAGTASTIVMTGTAQSNGAQIPLAQIEARLITSSKDRFTTNGRRDLRAPKDGTIAYDQPGTTNFAWTATITVKPADVQRALGAEARILWLGRVPASGNEATIYENGADVIAGPAAPCTAPLEGAPTTPAVPQPPPAALDLAAPATAPVSPHSVIAFPSRDFISADGYTPGSTLVFNVFRAGALVGGSTEVTVGADGLAEVNHPGGGCWLGQTPNLRAGDVVRVTQKGAANVGEETTVANVVASRPQKVRNPVTGRDEIVITGTAATGGTESAPAGERLPLGQLEQRLVNPAKFANGRRTLRAPGDGTLQYVGDTGYAWRAVYPSLGSTDVTKALAAESRILWLGSDPLAGNQLTIFEIGDAALPGPAAPCTAPPEAG
jgi:hypothetical protein